MPNSIHQVRLATDSIDAGIRATLVEVWRPRDKRHPVAHLNIGLKATRDVREGGVSTILTIIIFRLALVATPRYISDENFRNFK